MQYAQYSEIENYIVLVSMSLHVKQGGQPRSSALEKCVVVFCYFLLL